MHKSVMQAVYNIFYLLQELLVLADSLNCPKSSAFWHICWVYHRVLDFFKYEFSLSINFTFLHGYFFNIV